jgi:exonuclease SbcD
MRFTFIHAADLHIDSPLAALGAKDAAVAARFARAGRAAVEKLVARTLEEKAAFLIISGDLFDGDWRDVSTGHFFARALGPLQRAGVPVFITRGNHDAESKIIRDLPYGGNVRFFPARKAETLTLEALGVALHGRSYPAREPPADFVRSYPPARPGLLNIGVLHTALQGTRDHAPYAPTSVEDLRRFGYDYWALGHVHAQAVVARDPWVVYPGNLQGRNVRETGAKGAMRVTVENGRIVDVAPFACDAARWASETLDVSELADEAAILAAVEARLEAAARAAEGLPLSLRLHLVGAHAEYARFVAERERLEDDIRARAFRYAEDFWIERLKVATQAPPQALAPDDALDIAALIAEAAAEPDFAVELERLTRDVADRMPVELGRALTDEMRETLASETRDRLIGALRAGSVS